MCVCEVGGQVESKNGILFYAGRSTYLNSIYLQPVLNGHYKRNRFRIGESGPSRPGGLAWWRATTISHFLSFAVCRKNFFWSDLPTFCLFFANVLFMTVKLRALCSAFDFCHVCFARLCASMFVYLFSFVYVTLRANSTWSPKSCSATYVTLGEK